MRERTAELERLNERARQRQDRGGGGESLQDALPRRRRPRHLAAAQRGAALRQFARRRSPPTAPSRSASRWCATSTLSLEAVEEILSRAARHLAPRRRRDAAGDRRLPGRDMFRQLEIEFAPTARAKGLALRFVADLAGRALRSPADAPPAAEPRLQRAQIHAKGPRAGRLPARWSARRAIEVWDTGLGIPADQQRPDVRGVPAARAGRAGGARPRPGPVDRRAPGPRARPRDRRCARGRARGSVFAVTAPLGAPAPRRGRSARSPALELTCRRRALERHARAGGRQRAAGARRHADAARPNGAAASPIARGLREAREALAALDGPPDAIVADYHLDQGDGLSAIAALRHQLGAPRAGDPRHRRPQRAKCARRPRGRRRAAQQAAEAGPAARPAHALPGAARRGGIGPLTAAGIATASGRSPRGSAGRNGWGRRSRRCARSRKATPIRATPPWRARRAGA